MKRESEAAAGKYGPEHEHRPGTRCPVSACTWPLRWETAPAVGVPVRMPLAPDTDAAVQTWAATIREAGYSRGMQDPLPVVKAGPAPASYPRTWPGLEVSTEEPHPAPLVPARHAREVEIPSAARTVRKLMEGNGWRVEATYALGWVIDAKGKTKALTHSLALRAMHQVVLAGPARHLVAVWTVKEPEEVLGRDWAERGRTWGVPPTAGWKFDLAYGWGAGQPHHKLSAAALKESIKEAGS